MALKRLSDAQLDARLDYLEQKIAQANPKDLPYLNSLFRKILEELVRRDLERRDCEKCD